MTTMLLHISQNYDHDRNVYSCQIYYHIMPAPAIYCYYHHSISTMCTTTTVIFIYVRFTPLSANSDNTALNRTEIQDF